MSENNLVISQVLEHFTSMSQHILYTSVKQTSIRHKTTSSGLIHELAPCTDSISFKRPIFPDLEENFRLFFLSFKLNKFPGET